LLFFSFISDSEIESCFEEDFLYPCRVCKIPCKWNGISWHYHMCTANNCFGKQIDLYGLMTIHYSSDLFYDYNSLTKLKAGKTCYHVETRLKNRCKKSRLPKKSCIGCR